MLIIVKHKCDSAYTQIYKGSFKQFIVKKLQPSTCYSFRVAAENVHGTSVFSKPVQIYTSGCVPDAPADAPRLVDATKSSLTLEWGPKRANETDYELQMHDSEDATTSAYGYVTIYNGAQLTYQVTDLRRCCVYQFRLRARNDEGAGAWSETKRFKTKADVPKNPGKPRVKPHYQPLPCYLASWDQPRDDGGDPVRFYTLELSEHQKEPTTFAPIYTGDKCEHLIEQKLRPGCSYLLRVCCSNTIGTSVHSDVTQFVTAPVVPGKCAPVKLAGKAKSNSVQLKWNYPDEDGGAEVSLYEVKLLDVDVEHVAYKGAEQTCTLANLLPGRAYSVRLRAFNKVGAGEWSDAFEFISGAGVPDAPNAPTVSSRASNCILVGWNEPASNGSPITEYRLEWSLKDVELFGQLYTGSAAKYELKGGSFLPSTRYETLKKNYL